ncbi:MAG: flagellar hook-associated protein FlgK [Candidatus Nanopelagicales bacterium]
MGSFDGLSVALSALYAQRRGLDVTGQNIANANTEGYSRQRVTLESVGAPNTPAIFAQSTVAGGGVQATGIERLRDAFLETRAQIGHAQLSELSAKTNVVTQIEQLFPEPSDRGLQAHLSDFWASLHDVANQPDSLSARAQLLQRATIVSDWLNQASASLSAQSSSATTDLSTLVLQANDAASRLAELNQGILQGSQAGLPINELQDQRDKLAMTLAESVGGTTLTDPDGTVGVYIGGSAVVRGNRAEALQLATSAGTVQLQWARDNSPVAVSGGKANALLDAVNTVIPSWSAQLDGVAAALASQVNAVHVNGYDLNGIQGVAFFSGASAASIKVVITDPKLIAASLIAPSGGNISLDGGNADALAILGDASTSPDAIYNQMIVSLGISSQSASGRLNTQNAIVSNIDGARASDSGVSLDEEMTQLLTYQRAYEAASRVLTAVDSALDTLVNRTGLVGR